MKHFAETLSDLLKERGISHGQLASALNLKQPTITRYVNGTREPDIDIILEIAKYFDVSVDYLLKGDG